MQYIVTFGGWFFSSPTAIIALISTIVALLAYRYQRRIQKKYNACIIAEKYAKEILPQIRIIKNILNSVKASEFTMMFTNISGFDSSEMKEIFEKNNKNIQDFKNILQNIKVDTWKKAILESGSDFCNQTWYNMITVETDVDAMTFAKSFEIFVHDFLNELEAMAILLRYNIADEELIYQSLHQTYLNNIDIWYFFIANENQLGENRYYENIIWLYHRWSQRKKKQRKRFEKQAKRLYVAKGV